MELYLPQRTLRTRRKPQQRAGIPWEMPRDASAHRGVPRLLPKRSGSLRELHPERQPSASSVSSVVKNPPVPPLPSRASNEGSCLLGEFDPLCVWSLHHKPLFHDAPGPGLESRSHPGRDKRVDPGLRQLHHERSCGRHHGEDLVAHLERTGTKSFASLSRDTARICKRLHNGVVGPSGHRMLLFQSGPNTIDSAHRCRLLCPAACQDCIGRALRARRTALGVAPRCWRATLTKCAWLAKPRSWATRERFR